MFGSYDCAFLKNMLKQGGLLIDVRSGYEFAQGALDGAKNMPLESFQHLSEDIVKEKPVLLYCRSGQRSEMAKRYLQSLGFPDVHNIGGYQQLANCASVA
jgi:phage shock protein E